MGCVVRATFQVPLYVFPKNIAFEVDEVAGNAIANVRVCVGVGDDGDFRDVILPACNGKADSIDGDGAFEDDVAREVTRHLHAIPPIVTLSGEMRDAAGTVHMAKDEVAAQFFSCGERLFEIYVSASLQRGKRGFGERLARKVRREVFLVAMYDCEAAAIDGDAAGDREVPRERRSVNGKFAASSTHFQVSDFSKMFNDAGKHVPLADVSFKIADLRIQPNLTACHERICRFQAAATKTLLKFSNIACTEQLLFQRRHSI